MKALLDVNVLIALAWEKHQFHPAATKWMEKNEHLGWATCAVTQIAFIRLSSQTSIFGNLAKTPEQARLLLSACITRKDHFFFSELPNASNCEEFSKIMGPNKVTDAYLVCVARFHHSRLVTFDQRLASLTSNKKLIEVILPTLPND